MTKETFIKSIFLNLITRQSGKYEVDISGIPHGITNFIVRQVVYSTDDTDSDTEEKMFFVNCDLFTSDSIACVVVYTGSPTFSSSPGTVVKLDKPLDKNKMNLEIKNIFNSDGIPKGFLGLILEFRK